MALMAKSRPSNRKARAMERLGICGSSLLPERVKELPCVEYAEATFRAIACFPNDGCNWGQHEYDDMVIRCMVALSKPDFFILELASLATYNMMDANISTDLSWAMDCILQRRKKSYEQKDTPMAITVQGAGPHFCPGGNPSAAQKAGRSHFDYAQFVGYHPFLSIRLMAVPTVQGSHGAQVGGGNAYALNTTVRACAHTTTLSYGNASRGAVPGMMLSRTLVDTINLPAAMDLYLADNTLSAYAANKADFMTRIFSGPAGAKQGARIIAEELCSSPYTHSAPRMIAPMDPCHFAKEAHGINMAARTGQMFTNIKGLFKTKALDLDEELELLFPAEPPRKGRGKGRPVQLSPLEKLSRKASIVHGPGIDGGILMIAKAMSQWCWATMAPTAPIKASVARYATPDSQNLHAPVLEAVKPLLSAWSSHPDSDGKKGIDIAKVAAVASQALWRDRFVATYAAAALDGAPLESLDLADPRRSLCKGRADAASVPLLEVRTNEKKGMGFALPSEALPGKDAWWWQLITSDAGYIAASFVVALLLACVATPDTTLLCDGEEVADFGMCRGRFKGAAKTLCVLKADVDEAVLIPSGLKKHAWTFVRTVSGKEHFIDLAAAQFGDASVGPTGCPLVSKPAEEFLQSYEEDGRDWDPIQCYREIFCYMLIARDAEAQASTISRTRPPKGYVDQYLAGGVGKLGGTQNLTMEAFFFALGKGCAYLDLLS